MLEISEVSLKRGTKTCVSKVSAVIEPGAFTAVVGPNGAGKSSLLKGVCGQWSLASGTVFINGKNLASFESRQRATQMAVMPQQQRINFDFTVNELVNFGRALYRRERPLDSAAIVAYCIKQVELTEYAQRGVLTLSGGELQRVYLAKAIAQLCDGPGVLPGKDKVLLLDEPTSALDMAQQVVAMKVMMNIARNGGTVLAVMHDLNLVSCFADRVLLMRDGCILAQGAPKNVLEPGTLKACFGCDVLVDKRAFDDKSIMSIYASAEA